MVVGRLVGGIGIEGLVASCFRQEAAMRDCKCCLQGLHLRAECWASDELRRGRATRSLVWNGIDAIDHTA